jgi:signal transduction histidine kinase
VASHDLKEPVRKIKTYSNRLRTEFGGEFSQSAQKYLEKIERSSERLFDLIDGILQYSSLDEEADHGSIVDLEELIRQIEMDLEITMREKQATIITSELPKIKGSPVLFHQLFFNLINNALKFSRRNVPPLIEISYAAIPNKDSKTGKGKFNREIEISVKDNGIGFEQTQSNKIFKTFTRLNPKTDYEGTGLGLALCKKIVERHHGHITAEGKPGEGSIFRIRLPLTDLYRIENRVDG